MRLSKLQKSTPSLLTSAQWSLFRLWQFEKEETEVFLSLLCTLQMRAAFIAAFARGKTIDDNKK
jgi:hypothetical protein